MIRRISVMPLAIFALIVLAALALDFIDYSWSGWLPATCMPDHCFCEAQRDGLIRQPINTYSNLAFVLVGLLIVAGAQDDWRRGEWRNRMQAKRALPFIFGGAVILIGLGSFFYHASLTFIGQWFDVMGMYLFASFALIYNYARLRPIRATTFAIAYVVMNGMLGYLLVVNPDVRRQVFAAMIYGIIALEALIWLVERPKIKTRFFVGALVVLAGAYGIWMLDESGALCDPSSLLQGHALWHILNAIAAGSLYLYYRSEDSNLSSDLPQSKNLLAS